MPPKKKNGFSQMRTEELAEAIAAANHAYYTQGTSTLSDEIWDLMVAELEKRDPDHPVLKAVGADIPASDARKTKLPHFMGSLDKIKPDANVLGRWTAKYPAPYVLSDKLDGISALLVCGSRKGSMKLYTRGNGTHGQDITHILEHIQNVPNPFPCDASAAAAPKKPIAVRGELIVARKTFEKHLQSRGANPRNLVAGAVNAKQPDVHVLKHVQFIPYAVLQPANLAPSQQFDFLKTDLGFTAVAHHTAVASALDVQQLSHMLDERRNKSAFEVDGVVVAHDAAHPPTREKNPAHAFAFKSLVLENTVEVIVTHVEWNVSKDGYLKPVVEFNPVHIAGVTIQRATGFNGEFIKENKIGPGARILVTRSGDVIPYIMEVRKPASSGEGQMPEGIKWKWNETEKEIMLDGKQKNAELEIKQLEHFTKTLEVDHVRGGTVRKLYDAGIDTLEKLYHVTPDQLAHAGLGPKMVEKIYAALQSAFQKMDCVRLMEASNMFGRGFGHRRLRAIVQALPRIETDRAYTPTVNELIALEGVKDAIAGAFLEGLAKFRAFQVSTQIPCSSRSPRPVSPTGPSADTKPAYRPSSPKPKASSSMEGVVAVFTGFRNKKLEADIENLGGRVGSSVSGKTTVVVAKSDTDKTGTKADAAERLGKPVILLADFLKKYDLTV